MLNIAEGCRHTLSHRNTGEMPRQHRFQPATEALKKYARHYGAPEGLIQDTRHFRHTRQRHARLPPRKAPPRWLNTQPHMMRAYDELFHIATQEDATICHTAYYAKKVSDSAYAMLTGCRSHSEDER